MSMMQNLPKRSAGTAGRTALKLTAAALMVVAVAGCSRHYGGPMVAGWRTLDVAEKHPIMVLKKPLYLDLRVRAGSSGLTPRQRAKVWDFLGRYRSEGAGALLVSTPSGTANEAAAFRVVAGIRKLARQAGISRRAINLDPVVGAGRQPPVKLSFLRYVAEGPECGIWPKNLADDPRNEPYTNFGCVQQKNLAAMIVNPKDLLGPRGDSPRSGERRDTVWGKYILGESTVAAKSAEEKDGDISSVGKK